MSENFETYASLLAEYDIGAIQNWRHLKGGMFLRPVLVTTDSGQYVLRGHTFRATESAFRFQAETLDFLAHEGIRCPRVLRDRSGGWGQERGAAFWALYEFLPGSFYDWQDWRKVKDNPDFLRGIGFHIARVHAALSEARPDGDEFLSPSLPPIQFDHLSDVRRQWQEDMRRLAQSAHHHAPQSAEALLTNRARIEGHWEWLQEQALHSGVTDLPRQLVHGDLSPVNMVFDDTRTRFGLIDWDCLHRGHRIYDALGDVLNRPPVEDAETASFRREEILQYLRGYQEGAATPLRPEEMRVILPLCLARQLEDLRQRMHVLPSLITEKDVEYAALIRGRVRMMDEMCAAVRHSDDWSQSLWT